jgi:hypothetical protein
VWGQVGVGSYREGLDRKWRREKWRPKGVRRALKIIDIGVEHGGFLLAASPRAGRPLSSPAISSSDSGKFQFPTLLGHPAFALEMALLTHLEGLFRVISAWYDGSTSTAMVKEI